MPPGAQLLSRQACSNVPGQGSRRLALALPEHSELVAPRSPARVAPRHHRGGAAQPLSPTLRPRGAMYGFVGVRSDRLPDSMIRRSRSICSSTSTCSSHWLDFNALRNHSSLNLPELPVDRRPRPHRGTAENYAAGDPVATRAVPQLRVVKVR
jgi:hypothetical protein